jgi:putative transposase
MKSRKAHVYRLYPTQDQAVTLGRWVGAVRFVYNLGLDQRRVFGRKGRSITYNMQAKDLTALRSEIDWIKDVPVHTLQHGLRDLDRAYQNWWKGQADAPTPRKRGFNDAMRFPAAVDSDFRRLARNVGEVRLPKIGAVRLRWDRDIPGTVRNITVSRKAGQWFAAVQYERDVSEPTESALPAIGIDLGVTTFAALSDGTLVPGPRPMVKAARRLKRAQQKLARKKKGLNNRRKQVRRVARLHQRMANVRKDFQHKLSTTIAKNHGVVVMEKLEIRNMTRSAKGTVEDPGNHVRAKSGLNRSIADQGWGAFRSMLAWKLTERGGALVLVDPKNTSRTCHECGTVDAGNRKEQKFLCVGCGHVAHADTNAARNILQRGRDTALLPAEARLPANEAGTSLDIAA